MCFLTGAVRPRLSSPGADSAQAGVPGLPGPGASRRPRCGHSLAQGTGGSGGDKTDGGWDNEGGRSASPDGPAVGVGAFLTLRTEVCRSAGRREPALG